jgi:hypothetical protein
MGTLCTSFVHFSQPHLQWSLLRVKLSLLGESELSGEEKANARARYAAMQPLSRKEVCEPACALV